MASRRRLGSGTCLHCNLEASVRAVLRDGYPRIFEDGFPQRIRDALDDIDEIGVVPDAGSIAPVKIRANVCCQPFSARRRCAGRIAYRS